MEVDRSLLGAVALLWQ